MPTSRSKLSHAQIVEAAFALLSERGVDGFSMRELGRRLGVAPMTVYGYFPDQATLLDAVVDHVATDLRRPPAEAGWREQLTALFDQLYETLMRHPFLVQIRRRQPMYSPGALRFEEVAFQILRGAGFDERETAWAYRSLFVYAFGQATFSTPAPELEENRRAAKSALALLPPQDYPAISTAEAAILDTLDATASFRYGFDLFLDGLEARRRG